MGGWVDELKIPVLEFLRNEALWITLYLDQDIRLGCGTTDNVFVFRRIGRDLRLNGNYGEGDLHRQSG